MLFQENLAMFITIVIFLLAAVFLPECIGFLCRRFIDPGFLAHQAVTRIAGNALLRLADSLILPYSLNDFANFVSRQVEETVQQYSDKLAQMEISLGKAL